MWLQLVWVAGAAGEGMAVCGWNWFGLQGLQVRGRLCVAAAGLGCRGCRCGYGCVWLQLVWASPHLTAGEGMAAWDGCVGFFMYAYMHVRVHTCMCACVRTNCRDGISGASAGASLETRNLKKNGKRREASSHQAAHRPVRKISVWNGAHCMEWCPIFLPERCS